MQFSNKPKQAGYTAPRCFSCLCCWQPCLQRGRHVCVFGMCEKVPLFRGSLFLFNSQAYLLRKILLLVSARARTNKCLARVLICEELRKLLMCNLSGVNSPFVLLLCWDLIPLGYFTADKIPWAQELQLACFRCICRCL